MLGIVKELPDPLRKKISSSIPRVQDKIEQTSETKCEQNTEENVIDLDGRNQRHRASKDKSSNSWNLWES